MIENILTSEEMKQSRIMCNHVFVDIGDIDATHREYKVEGANSTIYLPTDPSFSGFSFIKRSGKVLNVTKRLKYYKPFVLKERIDNVIVNVDDIVFFEPEVKSMAENEVTYAKDDRRWGVFPPVMTFKTVNGNIVYAISYHLLICALDSVTNELKMLNGKLLVRRILTEKIGSLYLPENLQYDNSKTNWVDVVCINNDEDYHGVFLARDVYAPMDIFKQTIENGYQVLIKRMASFDIQAAIKENKDIDELQGTHVVSRHNILAYRPTDDSDAIAYGLYCKVLMDKEIDKVSDAGIILKKSSSEAYRTGVVVSVGNGVDACNIGDNISFYNKNADVIDGYVYVHNEWVIMINE